MKKVLTLCMIVKDDQILLGMKKRGFGAGRWNGFGGKVEAGETILQATKREVEEEVGLECPVMNHVGILDFSFADNPITLEVHVFRSDSFEGTVVETDEMRPRWFSLSDIPYDEMWVDDQYWLPLLLSDKLFKGAFLFDRPSTADYSAQIISQSLDTVASL
jgi:8-oxo-dGTP diphosphatase/2-hydroxy-dATP diphosphatase